MKIKAVKFEVLGGEVYNDQIGLNADTWEGFDKILWKMSETSPKNGAYDKIDFRITFEDGETYQGRYDLKHWTCEPPNLRGHVGGHVGCVTGRIRPAWPNDEQWEQMKARHAELDDGKLLPRYIEFADKYDVGV